MRARILSVLLPTLLAAACAPGGERLPPSALDETLARLDFTPPPRQAAEVPPAGPKRETAEMPRARLWFGETPAAPTPVPPGTLRRTGEGTEIALEGASLVQFLDLVLRRVLGAGYVLTVPLEGEVTVTSAGPLDEAQLLALVETVLRAHGAALVRTGPRQFAVVARDVAFGGAGVAAPGTPLDLAPGYGVTVVPLRHLSAETAVRLVQPLLPDRDRVQVDEARDLLILVGTAAERRYAAEAVRAMDVDWMAGRSVGIFPLTRATPETVIRELEAILRPSGADEAEDPGLRLLPVERLNAVLAVTRDPERLARVERWVRRLDRGRTPGLQFAVYELRHVPAREMAELLTAALADLEEGPPPAIPAPATAGTVEMEGPAEEPPAPAAGPVAAGPGPLARVKVVPLESANALLIRGTPRAIELIEATLRRLDRPPLQVLIEATIVEVLLTDELRYGVQYFLDTANVRAGFNTTLGPGVTGKRGLEPLVRVPGFSFIYTGGNANVTIDALARLTELRVLSSPSLVVEDNRKATLVVGDEVPVVIRTARSVADPNAPVVSEVQFRKTGVILEVTPHVNAGDLVSLEIVQEVSRVADETGAAGNPVIQQRRLESRVAVTSGQTVVLGGLIQDSDSRGRERVPVLGDVPLLGELFAHKRRDGRRTELLVFLTPRIIRSAEDARAVSEELRARMRAFRRPPAAVPAAPPSAPGSPDPAPEAADPTAPAPAEAPAARPAATLLRPVRFAPPRPAPEGWRVRARHLPPPPRRPPPVPRPRPPKPLV